MAQHTLSEDRESLEQAMASFLKTMQNVVDNEEKYQLLLLDIVKTMCRMEAKMDLLFKEQIREEKV